MNYLFKSFAHFIIMFLISNPSILKSSSYIGDTSPLFVIYTAYIFFSVCQLPFHFAFFSFNKVVKFMESIFKKLLLCFLIMIRKLFPTPG